MNYSGLWNIYMTACGVWAFFPPWFLGSKTISIIAGIGMISIAIINTIFECIWED